MKSTNHQNRSTLVRRSLAVLGILGLTALAFGAGTYSELTRKIEKTQQDAKVLDYLTQAARIKLLLQALNKGQVAEARGVLTLTLTDDLRMAGTLISTANPGPAEQARSTIAQFAKDRLVHPEYYVASVRPADLHRVRSMQVARHDAKP